MFRNILIVIVLISICLVSSGCIALLAGAGGTVLWQGGKVISEESASMQRAASATKAAFKAKNITLTDEVTKNTVVQLRGEDPTHTKVAVDIFDKGRNNSRIEIRVGLGEEITGRDLLMLIKQRL